MTAQPPPAIPEPPPCVHPPRRRFAWFARDDSADEGLVLCVACCDCGAVLTGGVTLSELLEAKRHDRQIASLAG